MLKQFNPIAINDKYLVVINGLADIFFFPTVPSYPIGILIRFSLSLRDAIPKKRPGTESNKLKIPIIESTKDKTPKIYATINFPITHPLSLSITSFIVAFLGKSFIVSFAFAMLLRVSLFLPNVLARSLSTS